MSINGEGFDDEAFAKFAPESYSWKFIEKPALDRAIPGEAYTPFTRILDIGSGSGRIIDYHVRRGGLQENIAGIDPHEESVQRTRRLFPGANFVIQRAQDIDLGTESFDIVTAQLSLRYLDNKELATVARRVARALGNRGLFLLLDVHPARYGFDDGFENYFEEGLREVATPWGGSEQYYYRTMATYAQTLIDAGFYITRFDECSIAKEGFRPEHAVEHARYSVSPARFAITASPSLHFG